MTMQNTAECSSDNHPSYHADNDCSDIIAVDGTTYKWPNYVCFLITDVLVIILKTFFTFSAQTGSTF